ILVYATCSFEPEETTGMMAELQRSFPDFAPDWLPFQNEKIRASQSADRSSLTMLPSTHNTDGFFIARMRRKEK
ncbi:MAG TPA: 16S rRNA (cytosine(967)-C(5))-methyltransferase RsmB, partial [Candidatus Sumerlaeota bacterium]|nr:16S rRNA (cytosine(967)-C(5))-methyltransferase RsmB [Candidatus Sumerlaeota bacterium]